ncbi:MAG: hypothetical protein RMY34_33835 [Aulosira sp. DedQUE10]|nr:hypothetical protein [Aulosira sp. DedQUE10]
MRCQWLAQPSRDSYFDLATPLFYNTFLENCMNNSLIVKSELLLIILAIDFVIYSPVRAEIGQNQQQLEQQRKELTKEVSSQKLWEQLRQHQDKQTLLQQQRIEQFRVQNELRQQQPFGQLRLNQVRQQQRQQMETFKLQQKLREQQQR